MLYIDNSSIKAYIKSISGKTNYDIYKYILCVAPIINNIDDVNKYLGHAFNEKVSIAFRPTNHEHLIEYITQKDIDMYFNWLYLHTAENIL